MSKSPSTNLTTDRELQSEPETKKNTSYGYGYYNRPLRDYNAGQLTRSQVMLFEYLLSMGEYFLNQGYLSFWHSYETIHKNIGLAPDTAKKYLTKFEKAGLLTRGLENVKGVETTTYTINFLNIAKKLNFLFGEPSGKKMEEYQRIKQRKVALLHMHLTRKKLLRREY